MESDTEANRGSVHGSKWDRGIQVRFQMHDGTIICQDLFAQAIPVAALKQRVLAQWPRDRLVIPKSLNDIRLQIEGKVLEDSKTLAECASSSSSNLVGDLITVLAAVNLRGEIQETILEPPVIQRMGNVVSDPREQRIELRFRLNDGKDICHGYYPSSTTVAALTEMLIAEWPKDKEIITESVDGMTLVLGGKILVNSRTLAEYRSEHRRLIGEVITVHVLVAKGKERSPEGETSLSCC